MNPVYYGNHAYGVEAAARTYFSSRRASSTCRSALLAGLPQAPSDYDPFDYPERALQRRNDVLEALYRNHDISRGNLQEALRVKDLKLKPGRLYTRIREPYFFSYVRDQLVKKYGAETVRSGGLKVYTTIDRRFQRAANKAVHDTLYYDTDPASAIVAIDPRNGAIKTMTAVTPGRTGNQFNLVAQARRQAGSTFKTYVLAEAIAEGVNPDTTSYVSAPFHYQPDPYSQAWDVSTYSHTYVGSTSITRATLLSDNTVFARLTLDLGPEKVAAMAHRLGVRSSTLDERGRVRPVDRPRLDRRLAAGHGLGVRDDRRRRDLLRADGDPEGRARRRQARQGRRLGQAAPAPGDPGLGCGRGDEDPRAERPGRDRRRREHRAAGGRQDRNDREPRRRLVLRLHADALGHRLGRLPAGRDPDDERPRHLRRGRHLPGDDLAPVHGGGDRPDPGARLPGGTLGAGLAPVHAWAVRRRVYQPPAYVPPSTTTAQQTQSNAPPPPPPTVKHPPPLRPRAAASASPSRRPSATDFATPSAACSVSARQAPASCDSQPASPA